MYIKGGSQMYKIHFLYSVYENFNNRNNASMIYAFLLFLWLKCAYASSFCLYISLAYLTSVTSMHRMHSMHLWTPKAQKFVVLSINHGKSSINGQFPQGWVEDTCWEHWEDIFFYMRNHSLRPTPCLADQTSSKWTGHARPLAKWIGKPGPSGHWW